MRCRQMMTVGVLLSVATLFIYRSDLDTIVFEKRDLMKHLLNWQQSEWFLPILIACKGIPYGFVVYACTFGAFEGMAWLIVMMISFSMSMQAIMLTLVDGVSGIGLFFVAQMPQILCYGMALYRCIINRRDMWGKNREKYQLLVGLLCIAVGILCEYYLNPMLIKLYILNI